MQDPYITLQMIEEQKDETMLADFGNNSSNDDEVKSQIILFLKESVLPSDPLLKSVIEIITHYSKKYNSNSKQTIPQQKSATDIMFHKRVSGYYTPYKKIKEEIEKNKINFDEKLLIKMIENYSQSANKQLPLLIQFMDDYFVIKTHFIFSDDFDLSLLYPENDISIVEQISNHNQALRVPQDPEKNFEETQTSQNALVFYITALEKFQASFYVEAETLCMTTHQYPQQETKSPVVSAVAVAPASSLAQMGIFSPNSPKRSLDSSNNATVGDEIINLGQKIKAVEMQQDFAAAQEFLKQLRELAENALNEHANKKPRLGSKDEE